MSNAQSDGVVFHLDEGNSEKHTAVLRNISNLLESLGESTPVELVAHGAGITAVLADAPVAAALQTLLSRGVSVAACENTMRSKSLKPEQLTPGVHTVQAGIAEIVLRQRQGWAYIRP